MNQKAKTFLFLTSLAAGAFHVINRFQYTICTSKNVLNFSDNRYYEWRFGKIRYIKKGNGSPILLLHDLTAGSSSYEFSKVWSDLTDKHEVYCIDFLGYGLSDKPDITFTNYLYVQMVIDFIKNVIGRKTDIVATGDSFSIAVMACHNDKETVRKLIAINPQSLYRLNQIPSKQTRALKLLLDTPIIGTFLYNIHTSKSTFRKVFEEKYFYNPYLIDEKDVLSYAEAAHTIDHHSKHSFTSYEGRYTNANILHALKETDNSIYLIAGREEQNIETTVDNYIYYNSAIEAIYIEKTKHLPHLEKPEEVISSIKLFLE